MALLCKSSSFVIYISDANLSTLGTGMGTMHDYQKQQQVLNQENNGEPVQCDGLSAGPCTYYPTYVCICIIQSYNMYMFL